MILNNYLILSAFLFCTGIYGVLARKFDNLARREFKTVATGAARQNEQAARVPRPSLTCRPPPGTGFSGRRDRPCRVESPVPGVRPLR